MHWLLDDFFSIDPNLLEEILIILTSGTICLEQVYTVSKNVLLSLSNIQKDLEGLKDGQKRRYKAVVKELNEEFNFLKADIPRVGMSISHLPLFQTRRYLLQSLLAEDILY